MSYLQGSQASKLEPPDANEVYLRARPDREVVADVHFGIRTVPIPDPLNLRDGAVIVRVLLVSCDPAMRGWMSTASSYIAPIEIGAVMRSQGIGVVVHSRRNGFKPGDLVVGSTGWRDYAIVNGDALAQVRLPRDVPLSAALGVLGGTGLTAYFGLLDVGKPGKGQTVVVSAAAGATGGVAAQIAKNVMGCYTVGIAGGPQKCKYLTETLGLDGAVDYKDVTLGLDGGLKAALKGRGVDVYFDNVGGFVLDAVLRRINVGARVILCGAISRYNEKRDQVSEASGLWNYGQLITRRGSMHGFIVLDYASRFDAARRELTQWLKDGLISHHETRVCGLSQAPQALCALFQGENIGKMVVEVASYEINEHAQYPAAKL